MAGRGIVIAASWLSWFSVFFARLAPSSTLILIERDFSVTHGAASLIFTSYLLAYSAAQIPSGFLSDRVGPKNVAIAGLTTMSFSCLLMGLSPTLTIMTISSFLAGIGAGALYTPSTSLISTVFPPEERGRALGIGFSGMNVGASAAIALGGMLGSVIGWRWMFYVSAVLGVVGALLFAGIRIDGSRNQHSGGSVSSALGIEILKTSGIPLYIVSHALALMTYFSVSSFTPTYIATQSYLGLAEADLLFLTLPLSGVFGSIAGGYMVDMLKPRRVALVSLASISVGTMAIPFIGPGLNIVFPLLVIGIMSPAVSIALPLLVIERTPIDKRGAVLGWFNFGSLAGASIGPYIFGFTADLYGFSSSYIATSLPPLLSLFLLYIKDRL